MTRSPRRFSVRSSPIDGRGVYAVAELTEGEWLLEYQGDVITWEAANEQYYGQPDGNESLTYFFDLDNGSVIDGASNGNSARFINHGCEPNCEAVIDDGRVDIFAKRAIAPGEELLIDYGLVVDEPDDEIRALYACRCGSPRCRNTMLAA